MVPSIFESLITDRITDVLTVPFASMFVFYSDIPRSMVPRSFLELFWAKLFLILEAIQP